VSSTHRWALAQCLGATPEGRKELVGLTDGVRESAHHRLCEGQHATVLQLPAAPRVSGAEAPKHSAVA
jgi:hypothetical protein